MAFRSEDYTARQVVYQRRKKHLPTLFAVLGAIVLINLVGTISFQIAPIELSVTASIGIPGYTRLTIPPIGSISASTHRQPVKITVALQNIDLEGLKDLVSEAETDAQTILISHFSSRIKKTVVLLLLKYMGIAGIGGMLGVLILGKRSQRDLFTGFMIGSILLGVLIGTIYFSFNVQAFQHPKYQGIIEAAPWMINLIEESIVKVGELGELIKSLADNLYSVFNQIENLKGVGILTADLMVLHVSDIHNHPVAYDFVRQVIQSFPIDLVIDTGDLTDLGSPLEADIVKQIEQLGVTYVFISGNHDTPDVIERLEQTENVILIDTDLKHILGLSIAGIDDPSADSYSSRTAPTEELIELAGEINDKYRNEQPPDIFCVHNHRIASLLEPGIFPIVLYGHNHIQSFDQVDDTVYINAGTTGAAGIRGLQSKEPVPFSLSILYFLSDVEQNTYHLTAVDSMQVQGLEVSFSLERTFISPKGRNQMKDVEDSNQIFD